MEEIADIVGDDCTLIICKMYHQLKMVDIMKELGEFEYKEYGSPSRSYPRRCEETGELLYTSNKFEIFSLAISDAMPYGHTLLMRMVRQPNPHSPELWRREGSWSTVYRGHLPIRQMPVKKIGWFDYLKSFF